MVLVESKTKQPLIILSPFLILYVRSLIILLITSVWLISIGIYLVMECFLLLWYITNSSRATSISKLDFNSFFPFTK